MNATQKYESLLAIQEEAAQKEQEKQDAFNAYVLRRLRYLQQVGSSVASKATGRHGWQALEPFLDKADAWLLLPYWKLEVTKLTTYQVTIRLTDPRGWEKEPREYNIRKGMLNLSDRDLAKMVRGTVKEKKAEARRKAAEEAQKALKEAKRKLTAQQKEVDALEAALPKEA